MIHNAEDLYESNRKLVKLMQDANSELSDMITCYEKLGGYELTIEVLKEKRKTLHRFGAHAQNQCDHWTNSNKKYRDSINFSI